MSNLKRIDVLYYAALREQRGLSHEKLETAARTPRELYEELRARHGFRLSIESLKVAINDAFQDWETDLSAEDRVVFIPPVAGG